MENDLIDDQLLAPKEPPGKKWWNASGLIVLWVGLAFCLFSGLASYPEVWAAFGVVSIGTVCFFIEQWAVGIALVLSGLLVGVLSLLTFFPVGFFIGVGDFQLDILPLAVIVVLIYTNPDIMRSWAGKPEAVTEEDRQELLDAKSRKFQVPFRKKTTAELNKLVTDQTLVPAAIRAAEIILTEREDTQK